MRNFLNAMTDIGDTIGERSRKDEVKVSLKKISGISKEDELIVNVIIRRTVAYQRKGVVSF